MTGTEVLLFLHVLSAFALVAGVLAFGVMVRQAARPDGAAVLRMRTLARRLWDVGAAGTLVLGIWLALEEYEITDGWIVGALMLWVLAAVAGVRLGQELGVAARPGGSAQAATGRRNVGLFALAATATLAILLLMIFKPGA